MRMEQGKDATKEAVEKARAEQGKTRYWIGFRLLQFVFMGLFAFGLAAGVGDYSKAANLPYSMVTITTIVYGAIGMVATEIMARISKRW